MSKIQNGIFKSNASLSISKYERSTVYHAIKQKPQSISIKEIPTIKLFNEENFVKQSLKSLKNQNDDVQIGIYSLQNEINKMRDEILKYKQKESNFIQVLQNLNSNKFNVQEKYQYSIENEEKIKLKNKQLKQVLQRMRCDQIYYKYTTNQLENKRDKLNTVVKLNTNIQVNKFENLTNIEKGLQNVNMQEYQKKQMMNERVMELENQIKENQQALQNTEDREQHNKNLAIMAILEKTNQEVILLIQEIYRKMFLYIKIYCKFFESIDTQNLKKIQVN